MKKAFALLIALLAFAGAGKSQEKWSANVALGLGMPQTNLADNTYLGYKPNFAVTAGIGYQMGSFFRLRGDVLAGQLNGNDALQYYQTTIYEANLGLEFNLARVFDRKTNFKLNLYGGLGYGAMNSNLFDRQTRRRVQEIPVNNDRVFSLQSYALGGLNVGIPISPNLDLNLGYAHRFLFGQPWLDGTDSTSSDTYGMVTLGFTFQLPKRKDPSKIEVDAARFEHLNRRVDSLNSEVEAYAEMKESVARLEMSNQEKEMQVAALRNELDSLKQAPVPRVDGPVGRSLEGETTPAEISADLLDEVMYRVVIGSLPSRSLAQRFVERSKLDKSEMIIAYIESIKRYRIIYKSGRSKEEARKYLLEARRQYKDAWITQF